MGLLLALLLRPTLLRGLLLTPRALLREVLLTPTELLGELMLARLVIESLAILDDVDDTRLVVGAPTAELDDDKPPGATPLDVVELFTELGVDMLAFVDVGMELTDGGLLVDIEGSPTAVDDPDVGTKVSPSPPVPTDVRGPTGGGDVAGSLVDAPPTGSSEVGEPPMRPLSL